MFAVLREFMAGAASRAGDADSFRAPDVISGFQRHIHVHVDVGSVQFAYSEYHVIYWITMYIKHMHIIQNEICMSIIHIHCGSRCILVCCSIYHTSYMHTTGICCSI